MQDIVKLLVIVEMQIYGRKKVFVNTTKELGTKKRQNKCLLRSLKKILFDFMRDYSKWFFIIIKPIQKVGGQRKFMH